MEECVQAVVGKNKFLVKFEDGQKRYMRASSLSYVCEKEEVGEEVIFYILLFLFCLGDISKYYRETGDGRERPRSQVGGGFQDFK